MKDYLRLWALLQPYRLRIGLFFVFAILMVAFNALSFVMSGPFFQMLFEPEAFQVALPERVTNVDTLIAYLQYHLGTYIATHGQGQALMLVCVFIIGVFFFKNVFRYLSVFTIIPVRFGIAKRLRDRLYARVLEMHLGYFAEERKGDLIVRMTNDIEEFRVSALQMLESVLRDPVAIVISFGVMIAISPKLTLIAVVMTLFIVLVIGRISSKLKRRSTRAQDKMADVTSVIEETLGGLRIVKAFNAEAHQSKKFEAHNREHSQLLTRIWWRMATASPISEFLGAAVVCGLLLVGGFFVVRGEFLAGALISFIAMFWSMITPLKALSTAFFNLKKGFGAADRIFQLLETPSAIIDKPDAVALPTLSQGITYEEVSYSYEGERDVLSAVSFHLPKGQILALVGPSGAGKSTLADLLPRFYEVARGRILVDGIPIQEIKLADLRAMIGMVSQEPILFNDSIHNNIALGRPEATREEVIAAAQVANAHEFIMETEQGYDTPIGDRGMKLSGGQRQRLTIARAVLRNPPILILDEATSSLDSKSEQLVQEALFRLMRHRTSIVIAHRLSTIQHADQILVMQEGKVVEQGTHTELMARSGAYHKLVALQSLSSH